MCLSFNREKHVAPFSISWTPDAYFRAAFHNGRTCPLSRGRPSPGPLPPAPKKTRALFSLFGKSLVVVQQCRVRHGGSQDHSTLSYVLDSYYFCTVREREADRDFNQTLCVRPPSLPPPQISFPPKPTLRKSSPLVHGTSARNGGEKTTST